MLAFSGASASGGKADSPAEDFAGFVALEVETAPLSPRDKQRLIERERIAEVGLVQFQHEQYEMKKMMRLLAYFRDKAAGEIQAALGAIIDDLEENPPRHPQEIYARIEAFIGNQPFGGPDSLRQQLKDIYRRIKEWMERPDEELGRLAPA